jgi:V/A-type H+-transporting ATPase subunit E
MSTELLERIRREGEERINSLLREAEEEAKRRLEAAISELSRWREEALKRAHIEAEGEKRLILSRARARAREIVLKAKSEAGEELFRRLAQEAKELRQNSQHYKAFLKHCLDEAAREIQGTLLLQVDPQDEELLGELLEGTPHRIGGHIKTLGGFLATNERGDLLVDERLETRIQKLRELHRAELSRELFAPAAAVQSATGER